MPNEENGRHAIASRIIVQHSIAGIILPPLLTIGMTINTES